MVTNYGTFAEALYQVPGNPPTTGRKSTMTTDDQAATEAAQQIQCGYHIVENGGPPEDATAWLNANPNAPEWLRSIVQSVEAYGAPTSRTDSTWVSDQDGARAWTEDYPDGPSGYLHVPAQHRRWPAAVACAALLAGAGVVVAAGVWVGWHKAMEPDHRAPAPAPTTTTVVVPAPPAPSDTSTPPPSTPAAVPPAATLEPPQTPGLNANDRAFLAQLDRDVPPRNPGTDGSAVVTAQAICRALAGGTTQTQLVATMSQRYLTDAQAQAYVEDAVEFYCPHALGTGGV